MKTKIAGSLTLLFILTAFAAGAYAHDNRGYYSRKNVTTGTKNIDKGIEVTLSSNDPQVVRRIQEDIQYYGNALADEYDYGDDGYVTGDVKTEARKTDKGIQIALTSDDPQTVARIQKDAAHYEATLADEGYYCRHNGGDMARHRSSRHSCCNCGWD